jgi:hypothetical protein
MGRINLSHKILLPRPEGGTIDERPIRAGRSDGQGPGFRGPGGPRRGGFGGRH